MHFEVVLKNFDFEGIYVPSKRLVFNSGFNAFAILGIEGQGRQVYQISNVMPIYAKNW